MEINILNKKITSIKGVGKKTEALLARLGIYTCGDIVSYKPVKYVEFDKPAPIEPYTGDKKVCICGKLTKPAITTNAVAYKITSATITDGMNSIRAVWYNQAYISKIIKPYTSYVFVGNMVKRKNSIRMEHPVYYNPEDYSKLIGSLKEVYSLTSGLSNNTVLKLVANVLDSMQVQDDYLPKSIREYCKLPSLDSAIRGIHRPANKEELYLSKKRLSFDEFFLFLLSSRKLRKNMDSISSKYLIQHDSEVYNSFIDSLPYKLTSSQYECIDLIKKDISSGKVMNRLIQGDVGSGKTVVAAIALYATYRAGYQGVIMAPTEVLANQHFNTFNTFFAKLEHAPRLGILTGSMSKKAHNDVYHKLINHEIDILIGTHALIQESVDFSKLAMVVTDEQHRFGVKQRKYLADKGNQPHVLVMSATPIPRTLALVLYGDMDVSIINSKPKGRLPIKNAVIYKKDRAKAYKHILGELKKGHQAYIICPLVEESESIEAENVYDYGESLAKSDFKNYNIGVLHGKLSQQEKDNIMSDFANRHIHILVSTTVVEVGVDIANATVMLIEDAQRFGLASLHQLRGRVGRNNLQSYCIFVCTSGSENAKKRLDIIGGSNDGFHIAAEDLKLRGPGEFFGVIQSGRCEALFNEIYNETEVFELAYKSCEDIENAVHGISEDEYKILENKLNSYQNEHCINMVL